jgi:hypothetical protein
MMARQRSRFGLFVLAVLLLGAAAPGVASTRDFRWMAGTSLQAPELIFGAEDGARQAFRLSCGADGTRISVFARGTPRGLPADAESFPSRINLFLGRTEYSLGGQGTRLADGNSRLDALLPDALAFFQAMARQGRLVAVTFAGRTKAPAPEPQLVASFREACAALR